MSDSRLHTKARSVMPWLFSLAFHGAVTSTIWLAVSLQGTAIETQEKVFIERVEEQERQLEEELAQERNESHREVLKNQLAIEFEALLAASVDDELLESAMTEVESSLDAFLDGWDPDQSMPGEEELAAWRERTVEELDGHFEQSLEDMLVSQVRAYVHSKVAPDIAHQIERELRHSVGDDVRRRVERELADRRRERFGENAQPLKPESELSDVERALAEKAIAGSEPAARQRVAKAVRDKAIPQAAKRITRSVHRDLRRLGVDPKRFGEAVEREVKQALDAELASDKLAAENSFLSLRERTRRESFADHAAAERAVSAALKQLREAAETAKGYAESGEGKNDQPGEAAAVAEAAAKAVSQAREAVRSAQSSPLRDQKAVNGAASALKQQDAAAHLRDAQRAGEAGSDARRRELAQQAAGELSDAAEHLATLEQALSKVTPKREDLPAFDLAERLGEQQAQQALKALTDAANEALDRRADQIARQAANRTQVGAVIDTTNGDFGALMRAQSELSRAASKLKQGRGLAPSSLHQLPSLSPSKSGGRPSVERYNRAAYGRFLEDLKGRMRIDQKGDPRDEVEGMDSLADASKIDVPASVIVPPNTSAADLDESKDTEQVKQTKEDKREIPKPDFKTVAFGAMPRNESDITIDGYLGDWGELKHPLQMRYRHDDGAQPTLRNGTKVYLRWAPEGIYVAYQVRDDTGIQKDSPHPWQGDNLEFWIDVANTRVKSMRRATESHQFIFRPFGLREDQRATFFEMGRGHHGRRNMKLYTFRNGKTGLSRGRELQGGYVVEGFVHNTTLANPLLMPGSYVAVNLSLGVDDEYSTQTQWSAPKSIKSWDRPELWGDVLLLGSDGELRFVDYEQPDQEAKYVVAGKPIAVQIVDHDMNIRPDLHDRVMATIGMVGHGERVALILRETEPDSGRFQASLNTQGRFADPAENTLSLRPGARVRLTYNDPIDAYGHRQREVTAECPVAHPIVRVQRDKLQ